MSLIDWCPEDGYVDLSLIFFPLAFGIIIGIMIGLYWQFKRKRKLK